MKFVIPLLAVLFMVFTSCEKQAAVMNTGKTDAGVSTQGLADAFPNKKLTFWDNKQSYVLHLYGDVAYIRRNDANSPKYLYPIDTERFISIWKGFQALPEIDDHKNADPLTTKSRGSHIVVFLNEVAGIDIGPGRHSYSIPRGVFGDSYLEWDESVKDVIEEYLSEQVEASDS